MNRNQLPDELRLRAWLSVLADVAKEYPGHRTLSNIITNIESRLSYYEKSN